MGKTSTSQRSPLSPTLWPTESFRWPRSLAFAVLLIAALFASALALGALFRVLHVPLGNTTHPTEFVFVLSSLAELPVIALLIVFLPRLARRSLGELGFHQIRFRDLAYAVGGALAMILVTSVAGLIEQSAFHLKVHENVITFFNKSEPRGWIVAIALVASIYAPFFEEFVFRGFIFNAILRYVPVWAAIGLSALVFAGAHFEDPTSFFPLAMAGSVLALVYYRSGSLVTSMLTHGTFNFIELSLYLATQNK